jgi:serine phosphatase RsbU (regulator of sigma subunit)
MASLVAIRGPSTGKDFPLGEECVLGRSLGCDIYIGDLNVSRRHARIQTVDGVHEIEDLGSGNGTFVNELPISRHRLAADDEIRIGASAFRYQVEKRRQWSDDVLTVMADAVQISQLAVPGAGSGAMITPLERRPVAPAAGSIASEIRPPSGLTEERAVQMLEVVYAIADVIATELDLPKLLDKLLDYLFDIFPQADRGFILLVHPETGELVPEAIKQRSSGGQGLQFSRTMVNQVMMTGEGVIRGRTIPSGQDLALNLAGGEPQMGAPLICRGESLGTIHLEARAGARSFTQHGLELLQAIALQAAVAIAAARAGQQLLSQQRLEDDLRTARQIQRNFLPQRREPIQGLRFETYYGPANQIGGDFYDIIPVSPTRVGILIGDISGHGIAAALLMAKVATDIRIAARVPNAGAGEVLTLANQALVESGNEAMFATALYIVVDIEAQTLSLANAGHQPPLVVSDRFQGVAELEDPSAVALGVLPNMEYPVRVYEVKPGDVVVLYTDGINEAMNRQEHDYGMDRLRTIVAQPPCEPASLVQRVMADQRRFVGGAAQNDDQTVLAFGLMPPLARHPSLPR